MTGCLIEAGLWLLGSDARDLRFDAAIRVDGGMVAQIGAIEAVAYGNDDLPRYGARDAFAVPIIIGGAEGRLSPGSPANLALFKAGCVPKRADLIAALHGEASGVCDLFVGGRPLRADHAWVAGEESARAALQASLALAANAREEAIWTAAREAIAAWER